MNDNQQEKDEALKNKMLEKKRQMFQRQNSESSISSNRVKRTFSRDIFMIDRGKIRSRQNERYFLDIRAMVADMIETNDMNI